MLTSAEAAHRALEAADQCRLPRHRVYVFSEPGCSDNVSGLRAWTTIWAPKELAMSWNWQTFTDLEEAKSTTAVINYSSGQVYI